MADTEREIIYAINAPIFNKIYRTVNLPIENGFGFNQVLSITNTYPVLIPRLDSFVRLDMKSTDILKFLNEIGKKSSSVIVSNIYNYDENKRFVSWGMLDSVELEDKLYESYVWALDFYFSYNRPIFFHKQESINGFVLQSPKFQYNIKNDFRGNSEMANISFSSVLIRFTAESLTSGYRFTVRKIDLCSISAQVGLFLSDKLKFQPMKLAMTKEILDFVKDYGPGVYAGYIYSINNWEVQGKHKHELNLIMHLREIFYSPESIFQFYGQPTHETPYSYIVSIPRHVMENSLREVKRGTEYSMKNIKNQSSLYSSKIDSEKYVFRVLKPWVIFELVNAYCVDPTSTYTVKEILESENVLKAITNLVEGQSSFMSKNLIPARVRKLINILSRSQNDKGY
ncbi:hypothetical protein [Ferroplasma sp.]|uniref:hypothetical protein n=1 Tax=Ferroplasma sp. TaxID=2591003 RepID=UPI00262C6580|nr:hypothetical protein [Ferroplasma sp.]